MGKGLVLAKCFFEGSPKAYSGIAESLGCLQEQPRDSVKNVQRIKLSLTNLFPRGFGGTVGAGSAAQGLPVLRGFVGLGRTSADGLMLF